MGKMESNLLTLLENVRIMPLILVDGDSELKVS